MPNYKKMYLMMFNAATDAVQQTEDTLTKLKTAQLECEELYVNACETELQLKECKNTVCHTDDE